MSKRNRLSPWFHSEHQLPVSDWQEPDYAGFEPARKAMDELVSNWDTNSGTKQPMTLELIKQALEMLRCQGFRDC